jgi:Matrixin
MPRNRTTRHRSTTTGRARTRGVRPLPEFLEDRTLLYAVLGDQFTYSSRITYSLMPDGTSVGGVPSVLFQTLNAKYATATWEAQIEQAASIWEAAANVNLALVSDGGEAEGAAGDQQDDPRFGDIRIGMVPLGSGILAETFLPPPANGGTDSGDILLNSQIDWQVNSNYDLMTVMAHEFGHALGLGDVSTPTDPYPVMYGTYIGINQALTADDIAGIEAVDGDRTFDAYNQNGTRNLTYETASNITSNFTSSAQIAIPSLDITTAGQSEWFYFTVPSTTTGSMTVTVQSTNLSSFSPKLMLYNSSLSLVGQSSAVNSMGATVSVSTSVSSGQGYYVKVLAAAGYGGIGNYGLLVNAGSQSQSPIAPPDTLVPEEPSESGGSLNNAYSENGASWDPPAGAVYTSIGTLGGWVLQYTASASASPVTTGPGSAASTSPSQPASSTTTQAQAPVAPLPAPAPVSAAPSTTSKHRVKVDHPKPPRHTLGDRVRRVNDHADLKRLHTGV